MDRFIINGRFWRMKFVHPNSPFLIDRTGELKLATTDPKTSCVYLSSDLEGDMLNRVMVHELGHCVIFSFGLLDEIHRVVHPDYWIDAEEWICNFVADYGFKIFSVAYSILGEEAWLFVPHKINELIA